jgi:hypothetical protein
LARASDWRRLNSCPGLCPISHHNPARVGQAGHQAALVIGIAARAPVGAGLGDHLAKAIVGEGRGDGARVGEAGLPVMQVIAQAIGYPFPDFAGLSLRSLPNAN